jgi:hypothetical protein
MVKEYKLDHSSIKGEIITNIELGNLKIHWPREAQIYYVTS